MKPFSKTITGKSIKALFKRRAKRLGLYQAFPTVDPSLLDLLLFAVVLDSDPDCELSLLCDQVRTWLFNEPYQSDQPMTLLLSPGSHMSN